MLQVPLRTCIGCGAKKEKRNLIRFVSMNSILILDRKKNMGGRGYYLCPDSSCIKKVFKDGKKIKKPFKREVKDVKEAFNSLLSEVTS